MLKLKLQYFGHLMQRMDSLEKTLMLGKIEGKRRGQQRTRWLESITVQWTSCCCSVTQSCLMFCDQAFLSFTTSRSLLTLMSMESVMPPNHLILCCPLLLLPSVFPSIGVFSNELALCIRWPKYWNFNFSISPSTELFRVDFL